MHSGRVTAGGRHGRLTLECQGNGDKVRLVLGNGLAGKVFTQCSRNSWRVVSLLRQGHFHCGGPLPIRGKGLGRRRPAVTVLPSTAAPESALPVPEDRGDAITVLPVPIPGSGRGYLLLFPVNVNSYPQGQGTADNPCLFRRPFQRVNSSRFRH